MKATYFLAPALFAVVALASESPTVATSAPSPAPSVTVVVGGDSCDPVNGPFPTGYTECANVVNAILDTYNDQQQILSSLNAKVNKFEAFYYQQYSCAGHCGDAQNFSLLCSCDPNCRGKECCPKMEEECAATGSPSQAPSVAADSCQLRCTENDYIEGAVCQCDSGCVGYGDCCANLFDVCDVTFTATPTVFIPPTNSPTVSSCADRCGVEATAYDVDAACQCDNQCEFNGDCCADFSTETACHTCSEATCGSYVETNACQCDDKCADNEDCCHDQSVCATFL